MVAVSLGAIATAIVSVLLDIDLQKLYTCAIAFGLAAVILLALSLRGKKPGTDESTAAECEGERHDATWKGPYKDPLRWAFLPDAGPFQANASRHESYENELCAVKVVAMHRPTHEPWREQTKEYPFAWHLHGRKRLWEIRLQLRFKKVPVNQLFFGITLGGYVHVSGVSRHLQKLLLQACKSIVGDLYHSPGDDPARTRGEAEPPTFVMPLWAFDQFIVSDLGEQLDLTGDLEGLGMRRTDDVGLYIKSIRSTIESFSTDKVYTFCFWGVSQFLDCMNWEITGALPGMRIDFNRLCGAAPIYVAMYEIPGYGEAKTEDGQKELRHLPSQKIYYFHIAMWSELKPPRPEALPDILLADSEQKARNMAGSEKHALGFFDCCMHPDRSGIDNRLMGS
eukprot:TRINITY_DN66794_c0_g1_i1.p1 TRINITY_DN66794_c0_g1~~TRINITY_DN66794_c0_g1_i1.p1  ORF type:complete len:395 (+),score=54.15 TRINITY_DN66794_c0_g1_i1:69-1253(+)